tara:strand:+ start:2117 stop:2953 length:837 start_codon:yes stop_codon:yes gene_type:complete
MFNLIVKASPWADGQDTFPSSRIFEYTDRQLVDQFQPDGELDIAALAKLPTLLVEETFGQGDQVARVVSLLRGHQHGRDMVLEYAQEPSIPPIANKHLNDFSPELGIDEFEFSRTHWSVKNGDLFRSLLRNLQPRRNKPTVFQLSDPELIERTLVSVMMPFRSEFSPVYETLKGTAESVGFRCRRADDIWENPAIIQDIVSLIDRARVIICDCSGRNPNVFYEIGIAHTLGREVILITQDHEDIPFDLRHLRYVQYLNNGEGRTALGTALKERLATLI